MIMNCLIFVGVLTLQNVASYNWLYEADVFYFLKILRFELNRSGECFNYIVFTVAFLNFAEEGLYRDTTIVIYDDLRRNLLGTVHISVLAHPTYFTSLNQGPLISPMVEGILSDQKQGKG